MVSVANKLNVCVSLALRSASEPNDSPQLLRRFDVMVPRRNDLQLRDERTNLPLVENGVAERVDETETRRPFQAAGLKDERHQAALCIGDELHLLTLFVDPCDIDSHFLRSNGMFEPRVALNASAPNICWLPPFDILCSSMATTGKEYKDPNR
jgi:hypothetical protein